MKTLLIAVCALLSFEIHAKDISMVATDWEPYYGNELKEGGVITKLATAAFKRAGFNTTISFVPWARALKQVEDGESDVLLGAYYNKERAVTYIPSEGFYSIETALVANKSLGISKWGSLEELKPYRIGVARGYANSEAFDKADFLQKHVVGNPLQNLQKLSLGRVDMIVIAAGRLNYEASKKSKVDINSLVLLTPVLAKNSLHITGSRKTDGMKAKIKAFNTAIKEMKADGSFNHILKSYGF